MLNTHDRSLILEYISGDNNGLYIDEAEFTCRWFPYRLRVRVNKYRIYDFRSRKEVKLIIKQMSP